MFSIFHDNNYIDHALVSLLILFRNVIVMTFVSVLCLTRQDKYYVVKVQDNFMRLQLTMFSCNIIIINVIVKNQNLPIKINKQL